MAQTKSEGAYLNLLHEPTFALGSLVSKYTVY